MLLSKDWRLSCFRLSLPLTQSPSDYFATIHLNFTDHLIQDFLIFFLSAQLQFLRVIVLRRKQSLIGTVHIPQRRNHQFYSFTVASKLHTSHQLYLTCIRNWYWTLAVCKFLCRAGKAWHRKRWWTSGYHCSRDYASQFSNHIRSTFKGEDVQRDSKYLEISRLEQLYAHSTLVRRQSPLNHLSSLH